MTVPALVGGTHEFKPACIEDTRSTVLASILRWFTSPDLCTSKVLWLVDISGSGKSAVARHIAYTTSLHNQLLCSFFFKRDIEPQSSTSRVISTLAREIARIGGPIASEIAQSSRDANGLGYTEAFHTQITLPLCRHPPIGPCLILIDALDESGTPAERAEFLAALVHEIPLLPDNVKLMVTSKPAQDIDDAFNKLSGAVADYDQDDQEVYRLTFDVYGQENRRDLRRFIAYTFDRVARLKRENGVELSEYWPSNDERKSLVAHANGLFLWVSVAAEHVACSTDPQQALDELLRLTNRPSPEAAMDALYKHVLSSAEKSDRFNFAIYRSVLGRVLTALNPLSIDELTSALGSDVELIVAYLKPVLSLECGVRIVHQSFREFVQDPQKCEGRFLVAGELATTDMNSPALSHSTLNRTGSGGSSQSPLSPTGTRPRLGTIASYPHARHLALDMGPHIDESSIPVRAAAGGAFGGVWHAQCRDGRAIAIKSLRPDATSLVDSRKLENDSVKELEVWSKLNHRNVLGLLGICVLDEGIGMVSEWMPNGNVVDYIYKHPGVDRMKLVQDVTEGLAYLHLLKIVHGDLKGANIVISSNGTARLVDFGLARLVEESLGYSTASGVRGTFRWMAPELFDLNEGLKAKSTFTSDVYALGMTMLASRPSLVQGPP